MLQLLQPQDFPSAEALFRIAYTPLPYLQAPTFRTDASILNYGWRVENTLVGAVILQYITPECEVLDFAILPPHQRAGHAKQFLNAVQSTLPPETRYVLEVAMENQPAIRLYEACSFKHISTRKAYYRTATGTMDAWVMSREPLTQG